MTRRRLIEPGATWALSRRTTRRHFLLHPDASGQMKQAYWYSLGVAAQAHGVLVHAGCLMSTHSHEVVTDVRGELPRFLATFHRLLALTTKAYRGWPEEVFNKRATGAHRLLTPEATLEALAYLIANPVEARAVRDARDWPGAQTLPRDIGTRTLRIRRPDHYFDPHNRDWPDVLTLHLEMPASLALDYGIPLAQQRLAARVRDRERRALAEAKRCGLSFLGPKRLLRLPHTTRARSDEVFGSLNPQFAAAGHCEAAAQAVRHLRHFNAQYDRALAAWCAGDRTACFPHGTWWMRVCHGARCGPAP